VLVQEAALFINYLFKKSELAARHSTISLVIIDINLTLHYARVVIAKLRIITFCLFTSYIAYSGFAVLHNLKKVK